MPFVPSLRFIRRLRPGRRPAPEAGPASPPGEAERLLRRLDFTVVRRLDGLRQGDHRNAAYGAGLDLAELREYQAGDDVRALDWNVTARMGTPFVRRYHEDRDITAWLVLDLTRSSWFGSGLQSKQELLVDVAGTLARLLTSRGDRVGALLYTGSTAARRRVLDQSRSRYEGYGGRGRSESWWWERQRDGDTGGGAGPAEVVHSGWGRQHVLHLLQRVVIACDRTPAPDPRFPERERRQTDLASLLAQAFRTATQRSLIFIVSDFLDAFEPSAALAGAGDGDWRGAGQAGPPRAGLETAGWAQALGPLARRHEVVGVWIQDPREQALPDVGVVTFEDAESGEQIVVDTSQPSLRAAYAALAAGRVRQMERLFARHGAALWRLSTDEPFVPALVRFLEERRRTALGAQRLLGHLA
jgi:uncharacterized protein (DUF58 family)